ncbi:MAG: sigma-54-dependent Fis family transcriptional regulator [Magnetococcales bacterium]|nr:sigma-54-dependent Fis family transcriptional regulator [Magnetococcales bacterium]
MSRTILIIDDKMNMQRVMRMTLEEAGFRVLTFGRAEEAVESLQDPNLDVILCDLKMPGMSGEEFIGISRRERPDIPIVIVTAFGSIRSAITCIQAGASDYLTKPFEPEELLLSVKNALHISDLTRENHQLQAALSGIRPLRPLVGESAAIQRLRQEIDKVAPYRSNLLITGESGTGKEIVAHTIHVKSPRASRPWVAVNCSAIPYSLMESELFGHVRGAFTGATQQRLGKLEQAHGSTLFLDEIGDMEPGLQSKLLRVLQEREFSQVGSNRVRHVDVRIIAATNRDLKSLVAQGVFREDLLYRLDVYTINVPSLRERKEDISLLAQFFLKQLRTDMDKAVTGFTPATLEALNHYSWLGNVRELRNAVERSLLSASGTMITREDLPDRIRVAGGANPAESGLAAMAGHNLDEWLMQCERQVITEALERSQGIQAQAARLLGISERSMWHRLKKLGLQVTRNLHPPQS